MIINAMTANPPAAPPAIAAMGTFFGALPSVIPSEFESDATGLVELGSEAELGDVVCSAVLLVEDDEEEVVDEVDGEGRVEERID